MRRHPKIADLRGASRSQLPPRTRTGDGMAANDPGARRAAAAKAARARVAALTPAERQAMTAKARATLRERDLQNIDDWARRTGRYPLDATTRDNLAADFGRQRAYRASLAAAEARRRRAVLAVALRIEGRFRKALPS